MLWAIVILLTLILCVLLGLGRFLIVLASLILFGFAVLILGQGDADRMLAMSAWGLVVIAIGGAADWLLNPGPRHCVYCDEEIKRAALVCKHCGREQPEPAPRRRMFMVRNSKLIGNALRMPDWSRITVSEYLGAAVMVAGVATVGFIVLFILIPT